MGFLRGILGSQFSVLSLKQNPSTSVFGLATDSRQLTTFFGILFSGLFAISPAQTSSTAHVLLAPMGARQTAMAGAGTAGTDATGLLAANPAAVAGASERFIHAEEAREFPQLRRDGLQALAGFGANRFGIGLFYSLDGGIVPADLEGHYDSTATFGWQDLVAAIHYGRTAGRWAFGAGLKGFRETVMEFSRDGVALDLGGRVSLGPNAAAGLAILNLGRAESFGSGTREDLPLLCKAGIQGRRVFGKFSVEALADIQALVNEKTWWIPVGVETGYRDQFFLRAGYPLHREEARPSLGMGLRYRSFQIDYALVLAAHDFEAGHTLGLTFWNF